MSATNWMKRASGLILPRAKMDLACKFRFGVTDSDGSCCEENPYPGPTCPCPREDVSAKYPMCKSNTCNPCCWEVEFQGIGNALCSDCYGLNGRNIKLASYYSGYPYHRICAGVGSLGFLASEVVPIHRYLQCWNSEQAQAACFGWGLSAYNVSVYPVHDPYEEKSKLHLHVCYPYYGYSSAAPCLCHGGYGQAVWESDWFDDGTFDCSNGTTDVELSFVSSSPHTAIHYPCVIPDGELCSWAGSTATIRSVASEPGGDCSTPAHECGSCQEDMPTDASLEVEWVPGADWSGHGSCWQAQWLSREGVYPLMVQDGCSLSSEPSEVPCGNGSTSACAFTAMRSVGVGFGGGVFYGTTDCYAHINMQVGLAKNGMWNGDGLQGLCGYFGEGSYVPHESVNRPDLIVDGHINCGGFDGAVAQLSYAYKRRWPTRWIYPGHYNLTFRCS